MSHVEMVCMGSSLVSVVVVVAVPSSPSLSVTCFFYFSDNDNWPVNLGFVLFFF